MKSSINNKLLLLSQLLLINVIFLFLNKLSTLPIDYGHCGRKCKWNFLLTFHCIDIWCNRCSISSITMYNPNQQQLHHNRNPIIFSIASLAIMIMTPTSLYNKNCQSITIQTKEEWSPIFLRPKTIGLCS